MAEKITKRAIEGWTYGKADNKKDIRWCEDQSGFGVRIYPSGKKSFVIQYRPLGGAQKLMTLGDFGPLTLDIARQMAREKVVAVEKGVDPLAVKQAVVRGETVSDLCKHFLAGHVHAKTLDKPNGLASAPDVERRIDKVIIPAWGSRKVSSITNDDMREMHQGIVARGKLHEANRVYSLVSKLWNYGLEHKFVVPTWPNPTTGVKQLKEKPRERYLSEQEMPRLFAALETTPNIYIRGAILLYLFTAARKQELLEAQWKDFSEQAKTLLCQDTKNGTDMLYPLSDEAMEILAALPRVEGNPYIFPGRVPGKHVVNPYKTWENILESAGIQGVHLHDLRRTVGSYMVQSGVPLAVIGALLNHRSDKPTRIYTRMSTKPVRDAVDDHGKKLSAIRRGATLGSVNEGEDV